MERCHLNMIKSTYIYYLLINTRYYEVLTSSPPLPLPLVDLVLVDFQVKSTSVLVGGLGSSLPSTLRMTVLAITISFPSIVSMGFVLESERISISISHFGSDFTVKGPISLLMSVKESKAIFLVGTSALALDKILRSFLSVLKG